MKIFENLRDYIAELDKQGQLLQINQEVDCNLELGAIMKKNNNQKGPALLFNKLKGFPDGFRVFGSPVGAFHKPGMCYSRIATSLGMDPETNILELIEKLSTIEKLPPVKPQVVDTAPCKENIFIDDAVDLNTLPAPLLHEGDGGRYIGTWPVVVTRTPDNSWINWGMYRVMVYDDKTLGAPLIPTQHIGMQYAMWKEINQPMPFAIALGTDPLSPLMASMAIPAGVSEADVVGGFRNKPVEVVKCETVDLYVPASAEIVIEGYVSLDESRLEGPFVEYTGFLINSRKNWPVLNVTAITRRHDPILPAVCTGEPVEDHLCMSVSLAAGALNLLRKNGIPVKSAFIPPSASLHMMILALEEGIESGNDLIADIGRVFWSDKVGTFTPKIMLVNHDIDPVSLENVFWCFCTRSHPEKGTHFFRNTPIIPLCPYLTPEEKASARSTTVIYDCTWLPELPHEKIPMLANFNTVWPKDIQDKVNANWKTYGF